MDTVTRAPRRAQQPDPARIPARKLALALDQVQTVTAGDVDEHTATLLREVAGLALGALGESSVRPGAPSVRRALRWASGRTVGRPIPPAATAETPAPATPRRILVGVTGDADQADAVTVDLVDGVTLTGTRDALRQVLSEVGHLVNARALDQKAGVELTAEAETAAAELAAMLPGIDELVARAAEVCGRYQSAIVGHGLADGDEFDGAFSASTGGRLSELLGLLDCITENGGTSPEWEAELRARHLNGRPTQVLPPAAAAAVLEHAAGLASAVAPSITAARLEMNRLLDEAHPDAGRDPSPAVWADAEQRSGYGLVWSAAATLRDVIDLDTI